MAALYHGEVAYPEDEGVDDEEGFEAGDDRFGLHP